MQDKLPLIPKGATLWSYHWSNDFIIEVQRSGLHGRDCVEKHETSDLFLVSLSDNTGGYLLHGPFTTLEACQPCLASNCQCWRPEIKAAHNAIRQKIWAHIN